MKILVTGAKGFVGRNLVSQLYNIRDGKARNYGIDSEDLAVFMNMILTVTLPTLRNIARMQTLFSILPVLTARRTILSF